MLPENERLIRDTENLLHEIKRQYDELTEKHGNGDFRVAFIGLTGNVFHSMLLHLAAVTTSLSMPDWWQNYYQRTPNDNDVKSIQELGQLTKHSFMVYYISKAETMMRKTINLLSPDFDITGIKPFKQIYDEYLNKVGLEELIPLFDLARLMRNLVHNNGMYLSPRGTDRTINWKGETYEFKHMNQINFVTMDFIFHFYGEMVDAIFRIVTSEVMEDYDSIEDKYH